MKNLFMKGHYLYFILFSGTAIIILAMLWVEKFIEPEPVKGNFLPTDITHTYTETDADISKLLLNEEGLTIEEKKSLINLYLKDGAPTSRLVTYDVIKEKREKVYSEIMKRKISVDNEGGGNFSVRPVPK
jgi:hypothetical protein